MRFLTKIWLVLVAVALVHGAAWAASFTASLDRDTITLGEQATLSLKFEGVQPQDAPGLPRIAGLAFQYVGPSSSFSFINGQTTSSVTYNYIVTAQRDGEFTIPVLRANVGGQQLASAPLKLVVTKVNAPPAADVASGREPAFLKLIVPKNKVYVGEPMVGQLELYLRDDVQGVNNFQAHRLAHGWIQRRPNLRTAGSAPPRANRQSGLYRHPAGLAADGDPAGSADAGTVHGECGGRPAFAESGRRSVLQPVFQSNRAETSGVDDGVGQGRVAAAAGAKQAREFHRRGRQFHPVRHRRPDDGHGRRSHHRAGADLRARRARHGHAARRRTPGAISRPIRPPPRWRRGDQFGFQGTKTFEQIISPQNADVHELPALSFSFFNPDDGQYHTLTQPAVPLVVRTAAATPMPTLATVQNAAPENQTPQDILPLKVTLGTLSPGPDSAGRPAGVSRHAKPARAGVSGGFHLAPTDGQPGQ